MHKMTCCPPGGMSKKSKIKSLEAMKSHLEDYIAEIDERISDLEKGEEVEA